MISNGVTSVRSDNAQLVLATEATPPAFTQTPSNLTMYVGQSFTFQASATRGAATRDSAGKGTAAI